MVGCASFTQPSLNKDIERYSKLYKELLEIEESNNIIIYTKIPIQLKNKIDHILPVKLQWINKNGDVIKDIELNVPFNFLSDSKEEYR